MNSELQVMFILSLISRPELSSNTMVTMVMAILTSPTFEDRKGKPRRTVIEPEQLPIEQSKLMSKLLFQQLML